MDIAVHNLKFELLYKGSRDGFTNEAFILKCYNKGPTVFVAKLVNSRRFGGFAPDSWKDGVIGYDDKAFLFSLDNKIKYGPKKKEIGKHMAILVVVYYLVLIMLK